LVARTGAQHHRRLAAAVAGLALALQAGAQDAPAQAPFITTPPEVVARMLALARTGPQDFVIDLGAGDGRIVIHAARAHGARGLGVELDAELVALARAKAREAGVDTLTAFEAGDALRTDLRHASVVTIYLLPALLDQLRPRLLAQLRPGSRVVTHAFGMTGWTPDASERVRLSARHEGQGDESRIFLFVIPAQARGTWHAPGGWELRIGQNFQQVDIEVRRDGKALEPGKARLQGSALDFAGPGYAFRGSIKGAALAGELNGAKLVFTRVP
jgi:protein-L-isoaspartate O-methyltransferase